VRNITYAIGGALLFELQLRSPVQTRFLTNPSAIVFLSILIVTLGINVELGLGGEFHFAYTDVILDFGAALLFGFLCRAVAPMVLKDGAGRQAANFAIVLGLILTGIVFVLIIQGGEAGGIVHGPFGR